MPLDPMLLRILAQQGACSVKWSSSEDLFMMKSGKHPVSALAEYCSKRKWQLPDYSLIFDHGPAHHKQFLFKVLVNSVEYQPAVVCGNKKQAKAQAAIYALKGLGLIPEDAVISAV
ncbi:hypothetical protein OS493_009757 [Desmophyllum pertusum]|uniref:DRBM domain-containing protein n=1 Tax=Desmophyllum pertusum TaxID=174260 RepID=A0A9W9YRC2_9CNID|nr:hypothetical protein OS493_009757 [Desmophyllum pertusum]